MIIVVEGPDGAGKSTYCARFDPEHVVAPIPGDLSAPAGADLDEVARFWGDLHLRRWARACASEARTGVAVCDTDPLRLHRVWAVAPAPAFTRLRDRAREAIAERRMGIADLIACPAAPGRALTAWYAALDQVDPGRVVWSWPDRVPVNGERDRYDVALFDDWMANLPAV